jgi:DNA-binding phage protein
VNELFLLLVTLLLASVIGAGVLFWIITTIRRGRHGGGVDRMEFRMLTERVRAVGRLVGLEVHAKEIATATRGWNWLPPILLSQAKVAMIFQFEKQYSVELGTLTEGDVKDLGNARFRVELPPISGSLRLMDVEPYDIQQGRVLGLIDVINMNAERQAELMRTAQTQAAELFEKNDPRYIAQARDAIERQLHSIARLFDIELEIQWRTQPREGQPRIILDESLKAKTGPA